jgi:hypothetical protein
MMEIFDREGIELNKQGKKSAKQIKEIKQMANPGMWMYVGLGILVFGGCFSTVFGESSDAMGVFSMVIAGVGLVAALMGFGRWNSRRKLLAESVQTASGMVVFKDGEYIAETSTGKRLSYLGTGGGAALPPGKYSFYFLDSNGWILAGDPHDSEIEMKDRVNKILADAFGYDMGYLESSRKDAKEGILKSAQGIPDISFFMESVPKTSSDDVDGTITHTYFTVGGFKFEVPQRAVILNGFPHRVYYLGDKLQAIEIL